MIEVLAAAVPVDAIFLGKLFAMLGDVAGRHRRLGHRRRGRDRHLVDRRAWRLCRRRRSAGPPSSLLVLLYFSMSYLLIGAIFLGIGAQASTVREVQTLSMPVTMAQVADVRLRLARRRQAR